MDYNKEAKKSLDFLLKLRQIMDTKKARIQTGIPKVL